MKKTVSPVKYISFLVIILVFCGIIFSLFYIVKHSSGSAMQEDYSRITSEEYNTVFLSMYPVDTYQEEDFSHYRGLDLLKASYCIPDLAVLEDYMEHIAASGNNVVICYLGIRPDLAQPAELQSLLALYPSIHFEIILSYPQAQYWQELSQSEYEKVLDAYCTFLTSVPLFDANTAVYFFSTQEWLVSNPGNYDPSGQLTEAIAQTVMLHSDRDHSYQVTADNASALAGALTAFTNGRRNAPVTFPDLSDYCFIFFGDSIIGNFTDSTSIPGVVSGLTGATTYNLGQNGTCAAQLDADMLSLPLVSEAFFQGNLAMIPSDTNVTTGLSAYLETAPEDKQLCFVLNYGINDYYADAPVASEDPHDVATYSGAIRTAVETIRANVPQARIILCTPTPITRSQNGTEPQGESGNILENYADAALALSRELGTDILDNYHDLEITPQNETWYLSDKVHPTHACRYLLGTRIIDLFR